MAKNNIEIIVEATDKASPALKKVGGAVQEMADDTRRSSSKLESLQTNLKGIVLAAGTVGAAVFAAKKAFDFAAEGAQIERVRDTFDKLTASIGETASVVLGELRDATQGMVSDTGLMASANRFLSMGLAETGDQAAKLAKIAVTLGSAMGKEAGPAMEEFALLLSNQSIPRLDTFGISAGKVRNRIAELQAADKNLSRETAFMTAVMEEAQISMERLGGDVPVDSFSQMAAETANLGDELKILANTILGPVANALAVGLRETREGRDRWEEYHDAINKGIITQLEYERALADMSTGIRTAAEVEAEFTAKIEANKEAMQAITDEYADVDGKLRNYIKTSDEAVTVTAQTEEEFKAAQKAAEAYGDAMSNARRATNGFVDSVDNASEVAAGMGQNFRIGMNSIGLLNESLDELGSFMVTVGGRTADQNAILSDASDEYDRLGKEIARVTAAPELYGLTVEEAAEKTAELADRQAELLPLMDRMGSITGTASLATREATVNQDALNKQLFDLVSAGGASTEQIVALGLSMGTLNEQQADAIIKAWELQEGIKAIEQAYKDQQISAEEARDAVLLLGQDGPAAMQEFLDSLAVTGDMAGTLLNRLNAIRDAIDNLPTYKRIEIEQVFTGQGQTDFPGNTPGGPPPGGGGGNNGGGGGGTGGPPGPPEFAHGGSFIVPPGGPFPMIVHPGERVDVTPREQVNHFSMSVYTSAQSSTVIDDFRLMQAQAGR